MPTSKRRQELPRGLSGVTDSMVEMVAVMAARVEMAARVAAATGAMAVTVVMLVAMVLSV